MFSLAEIFNTSASGLLQTINATSIFGDCSPLSTEWRATEFDEGWERSSGGEVKCSMILAVLLPVPDAKIAIFFTGQI